MDSHDFNGYGEAFISFTIRKKEPPDFEVKKNQTIQRWKVKAIVDHDDVDKFEYHVHHEKDSKVFQYDPEKNKNYGAIKSVNSVEKVKDENSVIMDIFIDSSKFSIGFIENNKNWPKFVKRVERTGSFLNT